MNLKQSILMIISLKLINSISIESKNKEINLIPKITNTITLLNFENTNKSDSTLYTLKIECNNKVKNNLIFLEKAVNLCFQNEMVFNYKDLSNFLNNIKVEVLDYNFDKDLFINFSVRYYEKSKLKNFYFKQEFKILKTLPIIIKDQSINYDSENENDTKKIGSFKEGYLKNRKIDNFEIISSNKPDWVKFEFKKNDLILEIQKNPSKDVFTNFSFKITDNLTNLQSTEIIINLNNENPNDLRIFVRKIEILLCLVFIIFLLFFLILLTITKFENAEETINEPNQKIEIYKGNVLSDSIINWSKKQKSDSILIPQKSKNESIINFSKKSNSILNWSKKSKSTMAGKDSILDEDKHYEKLGKKDLEQGNSIIDIGDKISVISRNGDVSVISKNGDVGGISFFDGINFK